MADHTKVHIVQRHLRPCTSTVHALTIPVGYGDGVEVETMFLLKPGALPNDEKIIPDEVQRLAKALIIAAQSPRDYRLGWRKQGIPRQVRLQERVNVIRQRRRRLVELGLKVKK
jgi:hypothetical protein